jgi:hypothetical protein
MFQRSAAPRDLRRRRRRVSRREGAQLGWRRAAASHVPRTRPPRARGRRRRRRRRRIVRPAGFLLWRGGRPGRPGVQLLGRRLGRGGKQEKEEAAAAPAAERARCTARLSLSLPARWSSCRAVCLSYGAKKLRDVERRALTESSSSPPCRVAGRRRIRVLRRFLLSETRFHTFERRAIQHALPISSRRRRRRSTPANDADEAIALGCDPAHRWVRLRVESLMLSPRPSAAAHKTVALRRRRPDCGTSDGEAVGTWA